MCSSDLVSPVTKKSRRWGMRSCQHPGMGMACHARKRHCPFALHPQPPTPQTPFTSPAPKVRHIPAYGASHRYPCGGSSPRSLRLLRVFAPSAQRPRSVVEGRVSYPPGCCAVPEFRTSGVADSCLHRGRTMACLGMARHAPTPWSVLSCLPLPSFASCSPSSSRLRAACPP